MRHLKFAAIVLALLVGFSCKHTAGGGSLLKIGNGIEVKPGDENKFTKPVVMLKSKATDDTYRGFCSATLVNDTTILTALHCIEREGKTILPYIETPNGHVQAINSFYNSEGLDLLVKIDELTAERDKVNAEFWKIDNKCDRSNPEAAAVVAELDRINDAVSDNFPKLPPIDLAILVFAKGTGDSITGGEAYYGVAEKKTEADDLVRFIGFGNNTTSLVRGNQTCDVDIQAEGFGVKRYGNNKLTESSDDMTLRISGYRNATEAEKENAKLGENVSVAPGDSGGPWISCQGSADCKSLELVGVNSTGSFSNRPTISAQGTRLQSEPSRLTIRKAVLCEEADKTRCAANFNGSGVATPDNPTPADSSIFMKLSTADPNNAKMVTLQVSVPADADSVYFCRGKDFEKCDKDSSKPLTFVRDAQGIANKIYRISEAVEMSETEPNAFSIVGRDSQGEIKVREVLEVVKL